jgi:hypothetical protein
MTNNDTRQQLGRTYKRDPDDDVGNDLPWVSNERGRTD